MNPNQTFKNLFQGNTSAYGVNNNGQHQLIKSKLTPELMDKHISGGISLGFIPIREDNTCKVGALDFDDHKKGGVKKDFDYNKLIKKIKLLNLPLNVFKSKSGGAHCYLFLDKFYPAADVRHMLQKFRYALGHNESLEIFPKQDKLKQNDFGSWINLSYHGGNSRVLINNEGKELNLDDAMLYASKRVVKLDKLDPYKLLADTKFTDSRNERLFRAKQFLKKVYPNDYENKVKDYNKLFVVPLDEREVESTVLADNSKDYWNNPEPEHLPDLVAYDVRAYLELNIPKPRWITPNLIQERSINFLFGEKGKGKTEFSLGLAFAICKAEPFLHYKAPEEETPVTVVDGEMDPYDLVQRTTPYIERFGYPKKDYLQLINFALQHEQTIPDIKEEPGQELILKHLQKQELLTGKKPILIFFTSA